MTMIRLPIFVWASLATSLLVVLATPVLTAGLIMLFADRRLGTFFFDPAHGGNVAATWQTRLLVLRPPRGLHADPGRPGGS